MSSVKKQTVSDTDKLFTAKTFKTEGNEFHKKKEFKKAIGKYHRALLQLKAIGQSKSAGLGAFMSDEDLESMGYSSNVTEEVQAETTQLLADCYNNLAACLLQDDKPNYEKIVEYCEYVLEYTPENIKAHYRKGLALYHMKNFEKAIDLFHQAASIAKNTKDPVFRSLIGKHISLCREGLKEQEEHMKATYRNMFSQPSGSGDHACLLQDDKPNYEKIVEYCEYVLEYTPENIKAHYRKGLALYHMKNFEKAIDLFHQAASIAKNTKDPVFRSLIAKQISLCREGLKEQEEHMKATYRNMFSQPSGSGDHG